MVDPSQEPSPPELTKKQSAMNALLASSGGNLLKTSERYEVLMRQIDTKIEKDGQSTETAQTVSYSKLISLATGYEKCKMYFGWCFACLAGAVLPTFIWLLGDVMDSFGQSASFDDTESQILNLAKVMGGLLLFVWIGGYAY